MIFPAKNRAILPTSNFELKQLWIYLRKQWFSQEILLDEFELVWSTRRQKRVLASCSLEKKRVNVARELNYPNYLPWLEALLYHELCHAYLGVYCKDLCDYRRHGVHFKELEKRHPLSKEFSRWVKQGGWNSAVRRDRALRAWKNRKIIFGVDDEKFD